MSALLLLLLTAVNTHDVVFADCDVAHSFKVDSYEYSFPPERMVFFCDGSNPQELHLVDCPTANVVQAVATFYGPVCGGDCSPGISPHAWYVVCDPPIFKGGFES